MKRLSTCKKKTTEFIFYMKHMKFRFDLCTFQHFVDIVSIEVYATVVVK